MKQNLNDYLLNNIQTFNHYFVNKPDCTVNSDWDFYNSAPLTVLYTNQDFWAQLNYTAFKVRTGQRGTEKQREEKRGR